MSARYRSLLVAVVALVVAAPASAQREEGGGPGGTVAFIGGGAVTSSTAGPLLGGTIVYDLSDRLSVEGQGAWFRRGSGAEAMSLNGSVLINLLPLGGAVVPYAAIGGGMYHASFDLAHARLLGAIQGPFAAGDQFCPSPGIGYMHRLGPGFGDCVVDATSEWWGVGRMPDFYARRLGMLVVPAEGRWGSRTFTDPAVSVGGGVRLNLARHLEVRPDARAIVVFDGGRSHTVGLFGVNIGYRF